MLTVKDIRDLKGKRKICFVQVTRGEEAVAAAAAGMDMVGTAFIAERQDFPKLIPDTHFQFGLPWGKHANVEEALRDAMAAMEAGAQSIYCGMSPAIVEGLAREGIPVIAHVGLVPPKATWVGGMRAVGKTAEQAKLVYNEAKDFENAGAFALEMEVIPVQLAEHITNNTTLVTISLGSGPHADAVYLFSADLLGDNEGHIPRHAKVYRDLSGIRRQMQEERVSAYGEYINDIRNQSFPTKQHNVVMPDEELDAFLADIAH